MRAPVQRDLVTFLGLQDPLSSLSHALGCLGMVCGVIWLLRRRPEATRPGALSYPALCGLQLVTSATYHSLAAGPGRALFWHLDHATIWIALAGAFTSSMTVLCRWQPRYLALVWALALGGAALELTSLRELSPWISPLLYVGMGWAGFPLWLEAARRHGPLGEPGWLMLGGGMATVGGVLDSFGAPNPWPGVIEAHEVMHLLILFGGWCYLWGIVLGVRRRAWLRVEEELALEEEGVALPVEVEREEG
ncbi:MAG: hemolysin III family protein [Planctomycetota bacterium]